MAQALSSPQRYRGFVLTDTGLLKLHERIKQLEAQTRLRQSPRIIAERIQLHEPEGIHPITVRKILGGQSGVDKRSIQLVFQVLQLQLEVNDYAHARLCQQPVEGAPAPELPPPQAWGEPVKDGSLCGREHELAHLNQAIVAKHYRLVQILGTAGIGKTALAAHLTKTVQPEFDCIIWKSLQHAPAIQPSLSSILQALSQSIGTQIELPASVEALLGLLIEQLQQHRCLLVFDHFNSLLDSRQYAGYCRPEHEAYGELLRLVAEVPHQSCLVITSREQPRMIQIGEERLSLQLSGLLTSAQQQIARAYSHLVGSTDDWQSLINLYHGHPLALKLVRGYVQKYFDHQISDYLNHLQQGQLLFGDLRDLLAQQFNRLVPVEQELVCCLAQYQAPISILQLREDFPSIRQQYLFEALDSLSRRSLLYQQGTGVSLDWMLKAYVNQCLIEQQDNAGSKSKLKIIYNKDTAI